MEDGRTVTEHSEKAALLLEDFKKRMGCSSNPIMLFNLEELVQPRNDLESFSRSFSTLDIDEVIKHMPPDKAPGPDGFNGLFMKKCWNIIKEDIHFVL